MKFQTRLENGRWVDENRIDFFIGLAVERDAVFATIQNRPQVTTQDVLSAIAAGEILPYDTDWYAKIRDADAIKPRIVIEEKLIKCDCGHHTAHPMRASLGTSCPDCYDRMSDN